jgi:hypothetical protein
MRRADGPDSDVLANVVWQYLAPFGQSTEREFADRCMVESF